MSATFVPSLCPLPAGVVNLADHEAAARSSLDDGAWAYFSGGAADEITLRANCRAWERVGLLPRVLQPLAHGHTRIELLGRTWAHPVLLAPVAYQCLAHPEGELASAHAAAAQSAGMVLSTLSSVPMEDVAAIMQAEAHRGPLWFQLYLQHDRGYNLELVQRAEAAGYEALVLTVDAPVHGARDRERRAGFSLPPHVRAVHLEGLPARSTRQQRIGQSVLFNDLLTHAPTWDDVSWLRSQTRLPILLKGVLHDADARLAAGLGVSGLIVSNHGGRTLDGAPPTAEILPRLRGAVPAEVAVLVDGGIRRGTDILKAMALGASAVLVGRPYVFGLAHSGAMGVAHVLRLLRDELEIAMALCGCRTLDQTSPSLLWHDARPEPPFRNTWAELSTSITDNSTSLIEK